jgi:hypothetical protein
VTTVLFEPACPHAGDVVIVSTPPPAPMGRTRTFSLQRQSYALKWNHPKELAVGSKKVLVKRGGHVARSVLSRSLVEKLLVPGLLLGAFAIPAQGVCVGNGNANTGQPANCPFWANVGFFKFQANGPGGGNFSYLGKNQAGECWCITARHLFDGGVPAQVHLNGHDYDIDPNSATDLLYMGIDIAFFKLVQDPGLPRLPIAAMASVTNDEFTLCGQGWYDRVLGTEGGQPCWFLQYSIDPPVRWARARNYSVDPNAVDGGGWNDSVADAGSAATYDSGGAVFCDNDSGALSAIIIGGHSVDDFVDPDLGAYDWDGYTGATSLVPIRAVIRTITVGLGGAIGDTDGDGDVDLQDLLNVKNFLGSLVGPGILGDTNNDGIVNLQDLLNVKNYLGL